MRQPGGHVRRRWSGSVQSAVFRGDELAGEHGHGPAPFNPDLVHITPPDEHAYLQAVWPGGPVGGGDIAAWPLRAAPAGP